VPTLTRASILAFRRAITERAAERSQRRSRGVPVALPPSAALTLYTGFLDRFSRDLDDAARGVLEPYGLNFSSHRSDALSDSHHIEHADANDEDYLHPDHISQIERDLRAAAMRLARDPKRLVIFSRVAQSVTAHTREQWAKQVKALIGIDLPRGDPSLVKLMERFRRENTDLIVSLAKDHIERVHAVLKEAGSGTRVETIRKRIQEQTGAVRSRAALIARDQVLSLNAQVTQERHKAAGVTEYIWRTSRDERVRDRHRELDGTRQRYDDPPVVDVRTGRREHAGQDFQCRCTAEPIIPGFDSV
jgi:SPP1 gp7 family putative phage head morphogenesis protein